MELNFQGGGPPAPRPPARRFGPRNIVGLLGGMMVWPILFVAFTSAPACMGFEDPTLRAIEGCPMAVAELGTPVSRAWLGWSCGNAETNDASGNASWTFPVVGPRGRGSVSILGTMRGGVWSIFSAQLDAGGRTIDVLACGVASGPVEIPRSTREATVESVIGSPPVTQGQACSIEVGPGDGPFPCRVAVQCGGVPLYGGSDTNGYAQCSRDAAGHVSVRDAEPTSSSGDPTLDLRLGDGQAILTDQTASGTWVVTLRFAP